jgi:hypothetical protein
VIGTHFWWKRKLLRRNKEQLGLGQVVLKANGEGNNFLNILSSLASIIILLLLLVAVISN